MNVRCVEDTEKSCQQNQKITSDKSMVGACVDSYIGRMSEACKAAPTAAEHVTQNQEQKDQY